MEYCVCETETKRRIRAFTALSLSLTVSFALAGFLFWPEELGIIKIVFFCLVFIFSIFWFFTYKFFKYFSNTKVFLSDDYLERVSRKLKDRISFEDIQRIRIVKKTGGGVREIRLYTQAKVLVIDGMDNFEELVKEITSRCQNSQIYIKNEPIDYDNILFMKTL